MKYDPLPTLPVVNADLGAVRLVEGSLAAQRYTNKEHRLFDVILVSASGQHGSFMMELTPAMIVHIANELLTDEERACVRVPAAAGLDA